jgi:hypothetical protein
MRPFPRARLSPQRNFVRGAREAHAREGRMMDFAAADAVFERPSAAKSPRAISTA